MLKELCVIGHPTRCAGADTELDHQIRCWHEMGVKVYICPTVDPDENCTSMKMEARDCVYIPCRDWKRLRGFHCISFCSGDFLEALPEIKKFARTTSFVNCMTWAFPKEIEMTRRNLISFHLYQTKHAQERISEKLKDKGKYRPLQFAPYFHQEDFVFTPDHPQDRFRFGRISRGDADKFGKSQFWIYETMTAPRPKMGFVLGWDSRCEKKFGKRPEDYIATFPEGGISQRQFYELCDAVIMTTDTFENLPRVGFEAMASGSVLVVDNRGGWKLLVDDGETGWLCKDEREFVYKASRLAHEDQERTDMRHAAHEKLTREWGLERSMKSWDKVFTEWQRVA